jgi:hypothetical protein
MQSEQYHAGSIEDPSCREERGGEDPHIEEIQAGFSQAKVG